MNDRGTYGKQINGYSPPMLGADFTEEPRTGAGKLLIALLGGAFVGHYASRLADVPSNKGIALGLVGGLFLNTLWEQRDELRHINQQLAARSI